MTETRGWVDSAGLRLAVWERGRPDAPTVLLVHGYPDNSSVWAGVAELLAERFRVVRFDLRGHGESEAPADRSGYLMSHLAGDLAAVIAAVGAPVHLVAHDWGSILSWPAVSDPRYAELFASFTTISGPSFDHIGPWRRDPANRRAARRQLAHSWYMAAFTVPRLPELVWRIPLLRKRFHAAYRDAANGLELYRANLSGPRRARRVGVPVLQIALTRDVYCLPELLSSADRWCSRLWRRPLDEGHWAIRSNPAAVARFVTEFVDHVEGAPESPELANARVALMRM
jgi:pimeloyl-ACP methyl ester carboxylesterase